MKNEQDLKAALRDAVNGILHVCDCSDRDQRYVAINAIVEFFAAIDLDDDIYVEILEECGGFDVDSDKMLDELIQEYAE